MGTDTEAPGWARDMVVTELRKAGPDGLAKGELQEAVGIGPTDLRAVLEALEVDGVVDPSDEGWVLAEYGEPDDDGEVLGQVVDDPDDEAAGAPSAGQDADERAVGPLPPALAGIPASAPYRARIVVDVMFHREADDNVVELAEGMSDAAVAGAKEAFPGLQVAGTVESIDVFDNPRRVWPPF